MGRARRYGVLTHSSTASARARKRSGKAFYGARLETLEESRPGRTRTATAQVSRPGIRMLVNNDWNNEDFGLGKYAGPPLEMGDRYSNTVYLLLGKAP